MKTKEFTIQNPTGLHARPASDLCKLCKSFQSDIRILTGEKKLNAKSVVSILTGELVKGKTIQVTAEGADEEKAITALTAFFENLTE